jgi:PAS domain-containing protein
MDYLILGLGIAFVPTALACAFLMTPKRAEAALRRSAFHLREAQRVANLGSWELDLVEGRLEWSDQVFRIFEIDSERFGASYQAFLALVHPDDREAVDGAYRRSVAEGQPYEIVHRLLMPDGRVKHVRERCETFYGDDGRPLRSVVTVQDISEQRRLEDGNRLLAAIVEASDDAVIGASLEGSVISWNRAAERIYGYSADEIVGQPVMHLCPPDRREEVRNIIARVGQGEHFEVSWQ